MAIIRLFFLSLLFLCSSLLNCMEEVLPPIANLPTGQRSWPVTGKSFFTVRVPYQSASPEKVALSYSKQENLKLCGIDGYVQLVPFGGKSIKSDFIGKYFSPIKNFNLMVSSQTVNVPPNNLAQNFTRSINPVHFNIHYIIPPQAIGEFESIISLRPTQDTAGLGFTYHQFLHGRGCENKGFWFEATGALQYVKNDVNLTETAIRTTGQVLEGTNANMIQAFRGGTESTDIKFGKIDGARKKTGVADIELKFGKKFLSTDCAQFDAYIGGLFPTGNRPNAEYMFEPIIGHNKHWGITVGSIFDCELYSDCYHALYFTNNVHGLYLFKNTQRRLFDLENRPWSRYMLIYPNQASAALGVGGIVNASEIFARNVNVLPGFAFTANNALRYERGCFQAELGYNFYSRQAEDIQLKNPFPEGPAIMDLTNVFVGNVVNQLSNVGNNNSGAGVAYSDFSRISENNIALESMAHPCVVANTIYGAIGYEWSICSFPIFTSLGSSYEWSHLNVDLNRWLVWGKIAIAF